MVERKFFSYTLFLIVLCSFLINQPKVYAETSVQGRISNTVWTPEGSPYNLTGNVVVPYGILSINPGTVINGNGYTINAVVKSMGIAKENVVFNNVKIERGLFYNYGDYTYSVVGGSSNSLVDIQYSEFNNSSIFTAVVLKESIPFK